MMAAELGTAQSTQSEVSFVGTQREVGRSPGFSAVVSALELLWCLEHRQHSTVWEQISP